jgi:hypothetical protein
MRRRQRHRLGGLRLRSLREQCLWHSSSPISGLNAQCCLTPRSTGHATAVHAGQLGGTLYIFANRPCAARRVAPVSSNVRPHTHAVPASPDGPRSAAFKLLTFARGSLASTATVNVLRAAATSARAVEPCPPASSWLWSPPAATPRQSSSSSISLLSRAVRGTRAHRRYGSVRRRAHAPQGKAGGACILRTCSFAKCGLTPRSRRGPTASYLARLQVVHIILPAGQAPCCRSRLTSNVRQHMAALCRYSVLARFVTHAAG